MHIWTAYLQWKYQYARRSRYALTKDIRKGSNSNTSSSFIFPYSACCQQASMFHLLATASVNAVFNCSWLDKTSIPYRQSGTAKIRDWLQFLQRLILRSTSSRILGTSPLLTQIQIPIEAIQKYNYNKKDAIFKFQTCCCCWRRALAIKKNP